QSGHDVGVGFPKDNGGAMPSNLLQLANSESNGTYLRLCKEHHIPPHPARFPKALPQFFIEFLTDPGDLVVDIFGGSCTTGEAAELTRRRWVAIDINLDYLRAGSFRFAGDRDKAAVNDILARIDSHEAPLIEPLQPQLL